MVELYSWKDPVLGPRQIPSVDNSLKGLELVTPDSIFNIDKEKNTVMHGGKECPSLVYRIHQTKSSWAQSQDKVSNQICDESTCFYCCVFFFQYKNMLFIFFCHTPRNFDRIRNCQAFEPIFICSNIKLVYMQMRNVW